MGNGFSLFAVRILAKPEMVILHDVILKMVILQDAIKNSEWGFSVFLKKKKILFLFKKKTKTGGWVFLKTVAIEPPVDL